MFERLKRWALALPRPWKRTAIVIADVLILSIALWLAYLLRLGRVFVPTPLQAAVGFAAPIVAIPVFLRFGLYRAVIRYIPERAALTIVQAMAVASAIWAAVFFLAALSGVDHAPRSLPVLYFVIGTAFVATSRFALKSWLGLAGDQSGDVRVLIYGANEAGMQLASALSADAGRRVVGFIDDDPNFQGRDLIGYRVHPAEIVGDLIRDLGVGEVVISLPRASAAHRHHIYERLNAFPVKIRTLPSIADLAAGKYRVGALREIDIDDLLGRSSVPPDPGLLREMIEGRTILVTGAGGSIGSELSRLIARWQPRRLVLFEANEFALYEIGRRIAGDQPRLDCVLVLGSVGNGDLVRRVFAENAVDAVFHAAAHKHVPLLEANVVEAVRNNVLGTAELARAALAAGVGHFVLISTDKAVYPTSVMGATKRWAELLTVDCARRAAAQGSSARFCAVRFGNVLGSNGSVVPLFKEQIVSGGPVTLTDGRMTRYFMSIHEAAELIVQAGALSAGADFFLLEMGAPILIRQLAENMIRLAGLSIRSPEHPGGDVEIEMVGTRPGEKLEEELFYNLAQVNRTRHPKILRAGRPLEIGHLDAVLAELRAAVERADGDAARRILFAFLADDAAVPVPVPAVRAG